MGSDEQTPPAAEPATRVRPVDLRDYADCREDTATRTRVLRSDHLAVDLWCIQPRTTTGVLHLPTQDVAYTVIGGRSWVVTDEGEVGLDPMGAILVPADTVHGIENRTPDPLIVLAACSPPGAEQPGSAVADDAQAISWSPQEAGPLQRLRSTLFGSNRPG